MTIKICFVAENEPDFVSSQIMKKMNTDYSHVLIVYDEDSTIFHAVGEGVCTEPAIEFFKSHKVIHQFEVELSCSRDFFLGFVAGSNGKEYSQSQIAALGTGKVATNNDEKMICSELVGIVLTRMANYLIPGHQDSWTPLDCLNSLKAGPRILH
jgi:hypothetical protein